MDFEVYADLKEGEGTKQEGAATQRVESDSDLSSCRALVTDTFKAPLRF